MLIHLPDAIAEIDHAFQKASRRLIKMSTLQGMDWPMADRKAVRKEHEQHILNLVALAEHQQAGRHRTVACRQAAILQAFPGRVSALVRVLAHPKTDWQSIRPVGWAGLQHRAANIDLFETIGEPARLVLREKRDGAMRYTLAFREKRRTAQLLTRDILMARFGHSRLDYNRMGGGRDCAAQRIKHEIEKGYEWWVTFDVANCYPSILSPHVKWIALPIPIERNVLFSFTTKIVAPDVGGSGQKEEDKPSPYYDANTNSECHEEAARRGLPMGSSLSAYVASLIICDRLAQLSLRYPVLSYVDDVAIGCRTKEEAKAVAARIAALFPEHPIGPLHSSMGGLSSAMLARVSGTSAIGPRLIRISVSRVSALPQRSLLSSMN